MAIGDKLFVADKPTLDLVKTFVDDLETRLTLARAGKLDNLDALISSRAAAATALSTATWTAARAAYLDQIPTINSRSHGNSIQLINFSQVSAVVQQWYTACTINGSGFLNAAYVYNVSGSQYVSLQIIIDGVTYNITDIITITEGMRGVDCAMYLPNVFFDTSLVVNVKNIATNPIHIGCGVDVSLI